MANKINLNPPVRSTEEARELGRKGGIKSGQVRRARKTFREALLSLLKNGDTQSKIINALIEKASFGDVKAFETIRDTIGEKPTDNDERTVIRTVYITQEEQKAVNKHIDDVINGCG